MSFSRAASEERFARGLALGVVLVAGVLLLSALFVGPAAAGEQSPGPEKAVLQQLSKAYAKVDSFEADFVQTSSGMSYAKPMVQLGRLYVQRPHKMHWDFIEPTRQQYISDGSTFWWVDHSVKTTTVYRKMDSVLGHFFDLLTGLSGATDNFRVSLESGEFTRPGCNTLKLVPRKDGAGLGTLYVHVSAESSLVVAVNNVTPFGDTTLLELGQMTLNEKHEPAHFEWKKADGFKLIEGG